MSGGHFDYICFRIAELADSLKQEIANNSKKDEWGDGHNYHKKTISTLKECHKLLEKAHKIAYQVEWLYSGDIGEETFIKEYTKIIGEDLDEKIK